MSKDKEALNTYEIIYSLGFKKIMSYYPIHITPEKHTQTDCKICFNHKSTLSNPVIHCDGCYTSFHKICYGVTVHELEGKDVLCDLCTFHRKYKNPINSIQCFLCK